MSDNELIEAYQQIIKAQQVTIESLNEIIEAQTKTIIHAMAYSLPPKKAIK